jgi:hypothetical protein
MISLLIPEEIAIPIPGLSGFALVLGKGGPGFTMFSVNVTVGPSFELKIPDASIGLRIPPSLLQPVAPNSRDILPGSVTITLGAEIAIGWASGKLTFHVTPQRRIDLPRAMIGTTGFIIAARGVGLDTANGDTRVSLDEVSLEPPPDLGQMPALSLRDCTISADGFTGSLGASWDVKTFLTNQKPHIDEAGSDLVIHLFGGDAIYAVKSLSLRIDHNALIEFNGQGLLELPANIIEGAVTTDLLIGRGGTFELSFRAGDKAALYQVSRPDFFDLTLTGLSVHRDPDQTAFTLSGDLQLTNSTVRELIPKFGVEGLTVFRKNEDWGYRLEGGRIALNKSFDLFNVAKVNIEEIGIGGEAGSKKFCISGGVHILDGIDAAGWVKGLCIPLEGGSGGVELEGIGLEVVVPDTFAFVGEVARKKEGDTEYFQGEIGLYLFPVEIEIGAAIKVGKNPDCRFAFISAYVNIPAPGIPLASLPIYIRGFKGLLGHCVRPDANTIFDYAPLAARPPVGLEDPGKWVDDATVPGAIGVGVRVSTASPKLFTLDAMLIYVNSTLLIQGSAFILQEPKPGKEPPFKALMALSLREPAALLSIQAEYEFVKGVLAVNGGMEVFYGPKTMSPAGTPFYFALGKRNPPFPADLPVRGKILKLFDANTFFIILPTSIAMGAGVGLPKKKISLSFASIHFEAWMQGLAVIAWAPVQFTGSLSLKGRVAFRIFSRGIDLSIRADVEGRAPDWRVSADLEFSLRFKILWHKVKIRGHLPFEWKKRRIPRIDPLLKEIGLQHAVSTTTWAPYIVTDPPAGSAIPPDVDISLLPEVEPDAFPTIEFAFPTQDNTQLPFGQDVSTVLDRVSGADVFRGSLPNQDAIEMWRRPLGGTWERFASPPNDGSFDPAVNTNPILFGAWQGDEAPDGTKGASHLHLFSRTPFDFNRPVRLSISRATPLVSSSLTGFGVTSTVVKNLITSFGSHKAITALAGSVVTIQGGDIVRQITTSAGVKTIPATSTTDVPVSQTTATSKQDRQALGKPLPYRAAQYTTNEHPTYPHSGIQYGPSGSVVPKAPPTLKCHNFLRTYPGFREYWQVIAIDDDDPKQAAKGEVLLGGVGYYRKQDGTGLGPLGPCEVVQDKTLPLEFRYVEWHCDRARGHGTTINNLRLISGKLKVAIARDVRSITINFQAVPVPEPVSIASTPATLRTRAGRPVTPTVATDRQTRQVICADSASAVKLGANRASLLQKPLSGAAAYAKPVDRPKFWESGKSVVISQVDWSKPGAVTIRVGPGDKPFNEVTFDVLTDIRIYSVCYEVDETSDLTATDKQVETFVDVTWPGRIPANGATSGGGTNDPPTNRGPDSTIATAWSPGPGGLEGPGVKTGLFGTPEGAIQPGFDYALRVKTEHRRVHRSDGTQNHEYWAYFRVPRPPSDMTPYVVTTFPRADAFRHYRATEWYVRYGRNYVHKLMGDELDKVVFQLRRSGQLLDTLPFRDDADANLTTFVTNTDAARKGWGWGKAPDHILTREEKVWRDAYNTTVPTSRQIEDSDAIPDSMSWAYPINPILLRADFAAGYPASLAPAVTATGERATDLWPVRAARLTHQAAGSPDSDSFVLTATDFDEDIIASAWVRPANANGTIGMVVAATSSIGTYLMIRFDLAANRIQLLQKTANNASPTVKKEFDLTLGQNRWTRVSIRLTSSDDGHAGISVDIAGETALSALTDLVGIRGHVGLVASGLAVADLDDLEVLSIARLEQIPSPGESHDLVQRYTGSGHEQDMYSLSFVASQYLDLRDHLNAWDKSVGRASQLEVSPRSGAGWTALETRTLTGDDTDPPGGWTGAAASVLKALSDLATVERNYQQGLAILSDLDDAKKTLRDARFNLDEHFDDLAGQLGFSPSPRPQRIDFVVSKTGRALFIELPEPIDWTRLLAGPIQETSGTPIPTRLLYSSDFTKAILLLSPATDATYFHPTTSYLWSIEQYGTLPDHLSWLRGWVENRRETHVLTIDIPAET